MADPTATFLDDSVSQDEIDLAYSDVTPTEFPDTEDQDVEDEGLAHLIVKPNTPAEGLAVFKHMRDNHIPIGGVGLCHYNCRHFGWDIAALWPDAETALEHGAPVHEVPMTAKGYASIPRGAQIGVANGRHGHSFTSLGASLGNTSDFHELGFNGVALISKVVEWAGGTRVAWYETVNGVDTWPDAAKPKPKPKPVPPPWDWQRRVKFLRHEADLLRHDHPHKADQLDRWADKIKAHHTK